MHVEITINEGLAIVSIEGDLNALDLLFMLQSSVYKKVIADNDKVLVDYSNINSSTLTMEDARGISLLGKIDLDKQQDIHIAFAVNENEWLVMEKVINDVFANSKAEVSIVKTKQQGINILKSG